MRILLVNDDGIFAPGLAALGEALKGAGHTVCVCAPDCERSAASHSITLSRELRVESAALPFADEARSVDGTPADCARLGLWLFPDVDIVMAGINNGSNLGGACIYSGTIGAAMEASMSGTPAMALSSCGYNRHEYALAASLSIPAAEWMSRHPLPAGCIYNLNVPDVSSDAFHGIHAASLAPTYLDTPNYLSTERDGKLFCAYRHGTELCSADNPNCDTVLIAQGWATLTQLTYDLRAKMPDPDVSDFGWKGC